jgi:hypothetical protein
VELACAGLAEGEDDDLSWTIADPESCLQLLTQLKELQDQDQVFILWPEGEKLAVTRRISLSDLHLKLGNTQSWLEMRGEVEVDQDTVLELRDLLQAAPTTRFVLLDQNRYVALSRNLRRRLQEIKELSESQAKSVKLPASSALFLDGLEQEVGSFEGDQAWSERRKAILEAREYTPVTVYRLVAENTVEEKIVRLHAEKRELADGLLEGSDVSHQVDAEELMQLLRHDGAWS